MISFETTLNMVPVTIVVLNLLVELMLSDSQHLEKNVAMAHEANLFITLSDKLH